MAQQFGELPKDESLAILSDERRWYPNVTGPFRNLRAQFDRGVREKIESLGLANRTSRRAAKRIVAKFDPAKAAAQAAPEMAMIFGLPENVFICSLVALLKGAITPEQASRRLFEAIAEPVAFVSIYFEKIETDRLLPEWISGLSRKLDTRITEFRDALLPSINAPNERIHLEKLLGEWPEELRTMALRIANENDLAEFGISVELRDRLLQSPPFAASVPAAKTLSAIIPQYIRQILGFLGSQSSIERSFGGDIIHALYLPHVDLWRGDRRFSNIVQNVLPELKDSVIPTLKELPSAIDNWNEKHLHDMPR